MKETRNEAYRSGSGKVNKIGIKCPKDPTENGKKSEEDYVGRKKNACLLKNIHKHIATFKTCGRSKFKRK